MRLARGGGCRDRRGCREGSREQALARKLTHYAISALICKAATEAQIDPDRVKFKRTVRILRRRVADPVFSP